MTIPTYEALMRPILNIASARNITRNNVTPEICELMSLTDEERTSRIPSGGSTYIGNRIGWAMTFLTKAKLIQKSASEKATYEITPQGKVFLKQYPTQITTKDLKQIEGWLEAWSSNKTSKNIDNTLETEAIENTPPEELIENALKIIHQELKNELLESLKLANPYFFERIVLDVLVAMGYGGSREEAAKVTQRSNDGGIDGIINEDRLGLDVIYIQAKRYQANVGRVDVQNFVGALAGHQAHKGVFITTSDFNTNALEYAKAVPQKLILINGDRLVELMFEFNVGVSIQKTFALKRIDTEYFEE